eukprot:130891-Pleurochrysis_carterae.AAC.2
METCTPEGCSRGKKSKLHKIIRRRWSHVTGHDKSTKRANEVETYVTSKKGKQTESNGDERAAEKTKVVKRKERGKMGVSEKGC